jgi:hypothetical protein
MGTLVHGSSNAAFMPRKNKSSSKVILITCQLVGRGSGEFAPFYTRHFNITKKEGAMYSCRGEFPFRLNCASYIFCQFLPKFEYSSQFLDSSTVRLQKNQTTIHQKGSGAKALEMDLKNISQALYSQMNAIAHGSRPLALHE